MDTGYSQEVDADAPTQLPDDDVDADAPTQIPTTQNMMEGELG